MLDLSMRATGSRLEAKTFDPGSDGMTDFKCGLQYIRVVVGVLGAWPMTSGCLQDYVIIAEHPYSSVAHRCVGPEEASGRD